EAKRHGGDGRHDGPKRHVTEHVEPTCPAVFRAQGVQQLVHHGAEGPSLAGPGACAPASSDDVPASNAATTRSSFTPREPLTKMTSSGVVVPRKASTARSASATNTVLTPRAAASSARKRAS